MGVGTLCEDPDCGLRRANQVGNRFADACSANGHKVDSIDLNNRSRVDTSSPEIIVAHAKRNYRRGDKGSVIHVLSRDRQLGRPHAEKDEDGQVNAGKRVDRNTVRSWYVPRPKYQFGIIRVLTSNTHLARLYAAGTASVEKKTRGGEIRGVEPGDCESD